MEWNIPTIVKLDWSEVVASAKRQRREMRLTQRRLAAIAGVSLPTVVKFEAGQDIRISSALAILKVLNMTEPPIEGTVQIRANGEGTESYHARFLPYAGEGGPPEFRTLADHGELETFLEDLPIGEEENRQALLALRRRDLAEVIRVQLPLHQLRRIWPGQFDRT